MQVPVALLRDSSHTKAIATVLSRYLWFLVFYRMNPENVASSGAIAICRVCPPKDRDWFGHGSAPNEFAPKAFG